MDAAQLATWQHADRLFAELVDLDLAEQQRRLNELSLSDSVRELLTRLLDSTNTHSWLDDEMLSADAWFDAGQSTASTAMHGRRFGIWEISGELGRGGMAVVYRALRVDGVVEQDAALKVLTVASLSRHGAERFQGETRILARLTHPHIVGLLDAGVTDDGTPWLAMPLVDGVHISNWCDTRAPDTRAIVQLFLQVAAAVASAHRSLVIHRDLKPSNVLVDNEGQVHLLDFGIARLLNEADHATLTQWRALTPQYAAPEQLSDAAPTTSVDIFGLGALLYRLLTGQAPRALDVAEITLPSQVARQSLGSAAHYPALRDDLDRVLMKALATDPAARYATVEELGADLQRWLNGRAVLAAAPGRMYRVRKFVARHRLGVIAVLGLLLLLLAGVSATVWQSRRAQHEAQRALAVKGLLVDILQSADPTRTGGADPPASELLRLGSERVRSQLEDRPLLQAEMLLLIGRAQLARGFHEQARDSLDTALGLYAAGLNDAGLQAQTQTERAVLDYELGHNDEAVRRLRDADRVAAHEVDALRWKIRAQLADQLNVAGDYEEASRLAAELIAAMQAQEETSSDTFFFALRSLAVATSARGQHAQAIGLLRQAEQGLLQHHAQSELLAATRNELGLTYLANSEPEAAEQAWIAALQQQQRMYGERHAVTLSTRVNLAGLHLQQGGAAMAITEFEQILEIEREVHAGQPHPQVVADLGWLAMAHYQAGDTTKASSIALSAQQMIQQLPESAHAPLAWIDRLQGLFHFELGKDDAAQLLGSLSERCADLNAVSPGSRWGCLAQFLLSADTGRCQVPNFEPASIKPISGIERRWQAVYWLLQLRCGNAEQAELASSALAELVDGAAPPFPVWLQQRLQALPSAN